MAVSTGRILRSSCDGRHQARIGGVMTNTLAVSPTHHVPHVGFPHSEPVTRERNVNIAPVMDIEDAIIDYNRALKAQPMAA